MQRVGPGHPRSPEMPDARLLPPEMPDCCHAEAPGGTPSCGAQQLCEPGASPPEPTQVEPGAPEPTQGEPGGGARWCEPTASRYKTPKSACLIYLASASKLFHRKLQVASVRSQSAARAEMSKKGLLNPQFNRVRTSDALKSNDMWEKTIGSVEERGTNEAIEAAIRAPTRGGVDKEARRERAQALIDASGYKPVVTDYQGLMNLARAQGGFSNATRGACKLCGGLGHRTKQCTNFLSGHNGASGSVDIVGGAAGLGLLPEPDAGDDSDLSLSGLDSSSSSSGSDSDSDSGSSDGGRHKRKRSSSKKEKSSKKKHKKDSKSEKKSKKSRKDEKKHKKDKKDKKEKSGKKSRQ
eukprot:gene3138-13151_t